MFKYDNSCMFSTFFSSKPDANRISRSKVIKLDVERNERYDFCVSILILKSFMLRDVIKSNCFNLNNDFSSIICLFLG